MKSRNWKFILLPRTRHLTLVLDLRGRPVVLFGARFSQFFAYLFGAFFFFFLILKNIECIWTVFPAFPRISRLFFLFFKNTFILKWIRLNLFESTRTGRDAKTYTPPCQWENKMSKGRTPWFHSRKTYYSASFSSQFPVRRQFRFRTPKPRLPTPPVSALTLFVIDSDLGRISLFRDEFSGD